MGPDLSMRTIYGTFSIEYLMLTLLIFVLQVMYLWLGRSCNEVFIRDVLGFPDYTSIPASMVSVYV